MSNIVKVPVHGEELWATEAEGAIWIPVARVCDMLGLKFPAQHQKLRTAPWATVTIIVMVAEDGKNREVFCVHVDSLPMWLATINPGKVATALRPKLVSYQRECARVLRDHFLKRHVASAAELRLKEILLLEKRAYEVKWQQRLYFELGRLYRLPYSGGRLPKWMASVTRKIYGMMYGIEAVAALKDMNPDPRFGSAHHQHINEKLLDADLGAVFTIANMSRDSDDFWSRMDWHFNRKSFQLQVWDLQRFGGSN